MRLRIKGYTIVCCAIVCTTILAFVLLRVMGVGMLSMANILGLLFPMLITELEVCSGIAYFSLGTQKRKIKTVLKGLRLFLALATFVLCVIWSIRWILKQYGWEDIPALAVCISGMLILLSSIADIFHYRYRETEKSFSRTIVLAGKLVYATLVIRLSFLGWMLNGSWLQM